VRHRGASSHSLLVGSVAIAGSLLLGACVQSADTYTRGLVVSGAGDPASSSVSASVPKTVQADTIELEAADRIARFRRIALSMGKAPPQVDQLFAPAHSVPGVNAPVPVVRLIFEESAIFEFDRATPRSEAMPIIEVVAENMRRDVPDAAVTVIGHTDAVGTDAYNIDLSKRRASTVLGELLKRGLNRHQLSAVAIGKAQPIAPNATDEGRARNRRVEFLISGSEQANLSVVRERQIDASYLGTQGTAPGPQSAQVLKPVRAPAHAADEGILGLSGILTLRPPG